jgi:hypothetical protein
MAENDVTIQVNLDAKDAQAAIDLFGKESAKVIKKTEDGFQSMGDQFKTFALKAAAGVAVLASLKKAVSEAVEEENGIRQLNLAIAGTGEFSAEASKGLLEFADSLGDITGLGDDAIRSSLTLAKSFGITNDAAKELVRAATNLSAVTGQDLESTVKQLGGTLDGSIGKLSNLGAEFRNLTEDQVKNLGVVDLINTKYGEAGEALGQTFSANLNRLTKAFDDSFKAVGQEIINDNTVQKLVTSFAESLKIIAPVLADIAKVALKVFGIIVEGLGYVVTGAAFAGEALGEFLGNEELTNKSREIQTTFFKMSDSIRKAGEETIDTNVKVKEFDKTLIKVSNSAKSAKDSFKDLGKDALKLAEEGKKFIDSVFASSGTDIEKAANKTQQTILEAEKRFKEGQFGVGVEADEKLYKVKLQLADNFNRDVSKINEAQRNKDFDEARKAAEDERKFLDDLASKQEFNVNNAANNPFGAAFTRKNKDLEGKAIEVTAEEVGAGVVGGFKLALQGKQGALKAVGSVAEGIGQSFGIPGLGGLAELLAQGPEATKKFIKEFIASIPDIIEAIAESIPVVVEALVDSLINDGGAARIGIAIGKAILFQPTFERLSQEIFGKSGEEIASTFGSGVSDYSKETQSAFEQFFTDLPVVLNSGLDSFARDLADAFNGFDDRFNAAFNEGIANFTATFGEFFSGLGNVLNVLITQFPTAIIQGVAEIVVDILQSIGTFLDPLIGALDSLRAAIEKSSSLGGKGGGQGLLAEGAARATSFFESKGFSRGGMVYAAGGAFVPRGTDTVPAMLTPGELVVPRDMVGELSGFLSRQSPQNSGSDSATLSAILAALQSPMNVSTEVKVNQSAFADIILQLNRQNARLSA